MQFGILGYGYVGKATHKGLLHNVDVVIHDINLNTERNILKYTETVFVCLPTETQTHVNILINELESIRSPPINKKS